MRVDERFFFLSFFFLFLPLPAFAAAPAGDAKPAAAAAKTEFAVKLVKFDAAAKIKVRLSCLGPEIAYAL